MGIESSHQSGMRNTLSEEDSPNSNNIGSMSAADSANPVLEGLAVASNSVNATLGIYCLAGIVDRSNLSV
jgi:hypothetical protein